MTDGSDENEDSGQACRHEHGEGLRAERVAALAKLFEADGPSDLDEMAGPLYWPDLSVAEAGREWNDLRAWVEGLDGPIHSSRPSRHPTVLVSSQRPCRSSGRTS